jgi:hypothetical protein
MRRADTAKFAERGGVDLIIIYNSGRYRMAGRGSLAGLLPYGDANAIVVDMGREVLPIVRETPVLAGVCGTDPRHSRSARTPVLTNLAGAATQRQFGVVIARNQARSAGRTSSLVAMRRLPARPRFAEWNPTIAPDGLTVVYHKPRRIRLFRMHHSTEGFRPISSVRRMASVPR